MRGTGATRRPSTWRANMARRWRCSHRRSWRPSPLHDLLPRGAPAKRARTMTSQRTSPPWSGSETGEYGRRPGGGASEASQETPWSFPAVLRTAPPRHFVPLPQQAGGENQRVRWAGAPVARQRNGGVRPKAGRGRERSEPGDTLEFPSGPADRAPSALRATPPASWGRNPKRPVGRLPRGAAAARGSTAEGREGARAKRAMRHAWSFPAGLRTAPPRPFEPPPQPGGGEHHRRPPHRPPRHAGGEIQRGQSDGPPVERQRQGALTMTSQGILPRGAAAERGSTAGGGEGARAKRARKPPCGPGGRYGPRPLGTSCHSPSK